MSSLIKVSEGVSIAMHSMLLMAMAPDEILTTSFIAEKLHVSAAHLSKVIQRLNHANLVKSTRGPKGGSMLAKDKDEISLLEIFEAIEGPYSFSDCLLDVPLCKNGCCLMGCLLQDTNRKLVKELKERTLGRITCID